MALVEKPQRCCPADTAGGAGENGKALDAGGSDAASKGMVLPRPRCGNGGRRGGAGFASDSKGRAENVWLGEPADGGGGAAGRVGDVGDGRGFVAVLSGCVCRLDGGIGSSSSSDDVSPSSPSHHLSSPPSLLPTASPLQASPLPSIP